MARVLLLILLLSAGIIKAQVSLLNPMEFPILLSGNFGELRPNHFHSGIDFKTQGVEGKAIHAVDSGYISRVGVSPWGFGNVIYIIHPSGLKTVYGHLQRFAPALAGFVKEKQYEGETFSVDIDLPPEAFPVKRGQLIAYSGNSGSSGGPHLHFEVRNAETDAVLDPLPYYKDKIADTRPPQMISFMLYPVEGKGIVNKSAHKLELKPVTDKNGRQTLSAKAEAWGEIGVAIKAYDYMDGTTNIYGVSRIVMAVDGKAIFSSDIDSFSIGLETRYINSFIDPEEWRDNRSFYMKSFIEPGNRLNSLKATNSGIITISEERPYLITYLLKDAAGNQKKYSFQIEGRRQDIIPVDTADTNRFYWKGDNRFGAKGIRLIIPDGNLYNTVNFRYAVDEERRALAPLHRLHDKYIPLHNSARLSIHLTTDTTEDKHKYGIVRMQGTRAAWIGGEYRNGWMDADIRELGNYTVMQDVTPPTITPVNPQQWESSRRIALRLSDNLSGVDTFRGEIDGQYALFEYDGKKSLATYTYDPARVDKGRHRVTFTLTDAAGNSTFYDCTVTFGSTVAPKKSAPAPKRTRKTK
jgi:hypothetical protein